jgi:putative Mn2+ efflux pump MntP
MKKTILVTFIMIFISNFGLISYASESDSNKYVLDNQYKNNFLLTSDEFVLATKEENESINPNVWLWSLLFPGVGQFAMGESGWGWGFFIPSFIITVLNIITLVFFISEGGWAIIGAYIINIPLTIVYLIIYFSSLINANNLNHSKIPSKKDSIAENMLNDNNQSEINEYLWASSLIIPGSGQILYGEYLRGFLFLIFETLLLIGGAYLTNGLNSSIFFIISLIIAGLVHIWNSFDSYDLKQKKSKDFIEKLHKGIRNKSKKERNSSNIIFKDNTLVYQFSF